MYHRARRIQPIFVCGVILIAACAGRAAPPHGPTPLAAAPTAKEISLDALKPYFFPGESIAWVLTYRGVEGGRAQIAVGAPDVVGGQRVVALSGEAETSGLFALVRRVKDITSSWIDAATGVPLRTRADGLLFGKETIVDVTWFPGDPRAELLIREEKRPERIDKRRMPSPHMHDPLSAILMLRGWDFPAGGKVRFYTLGGERLWRTDMTVEGRETIRSKLGKRAAIRVHGVSQRMTAGLADDTSKPARVYTVWFSDDAQRVPLKVVAETEYGDVVVEAVTYRPGT